MTEDNQKCYREALDDVSLERAAGRGRGASWARGARGRAPQRRNPVPTPPAHTHHIFACSKCSKLSLYCDLYHYLLVADRQTTTPVYTYRGCTYKVSR